MNDTDQHPDPTNSETVELLDELEQSLQGLLTRAQTGQLLEDTTVFQVIDGILSRLTVIPTPSPAIMDQLGRVEELHRQLNLTLTQQKAEIRSRLDHLQRGKQGVKSYLDAS
ncbi:MAG: hypothetical protein ACYS8X_02995 [Planctomycetota bacterium]|jgi:hypothetical protein